MEIRVDNFAPGPDGGRYASPVEVCADRVPPRRTCPWAAQRIIANWQKDRFQRSPISKQRPRVLRTRRQQFCFRSAAVNAMIDQRPPKHYFL